MKDRKKIPTSMVKRQERCDRLENHTNSDASRAHVAPGRMPSGRKTVTYSEHAHIQRSFSELSEGFRMN